MEVEAKTLIGLEKAQVIVLGQWGHIDAPIGKPRLVSSKEASGRETVWIGNLCIGATKTLVKRFDDPVPTFCLYVH